MSLLPIEESAVTHYFFWLPTPQGFLFNMNTAIVDNGFIYVDSEAT